MLRPLAAVTFVGALAIPVVPAYAADMVPFHAVINTAPAVVGPCGPTCLALEITGSGQATHLGRTHIDGPSQVDVVSATQTGTSTLMAAKGDTLVIAFSGTVTFTGPDPADPVLFAGTWNVIDGTGRFAGSSGGGSYGGNAAGPAGTLLLDGSISGPGNGN
jgi:hypothetical protein